MVVVPAKCSSKKMMIRFGDQKNDEVGSSGQHRKEFIFWLYYTKLFYVELLMVVEKLLLFFAYFIPEIIKMFRLWLTLIIKIMLDCSRH